MESIPGTSLIGVRKGTDGYWLEVLASTANITLDTTAGTYAIGCVVTNTVTGRKYVNMGTVAVPVWESTIQSKTISLSAAEIKTLYSVGKEVIAAVPSRIIVLDSFVLDLTGTATQFTTGGVVNLQYGSTVNGAGTTLHADIAATVLNGATARVVTLRTPKDLSAIATASITGLPVYIGAQTADFAVGTGTAQVRVTYHII